MKKIYALIKIQLAVLGLLLFGFSELSAQDRSIQGKVTGADDNSALPGVSVSIKGTTTGTITDANGTYRLSVPAGSPVLVFSFVGFLSEEVTLGNQTTVDVSLAPDVKALSEVVVTGYTTENRREVTGAVATVKARDIVAVPTGNVEQTLQGRVSGVTVITNGQPGTSSVVRLRGFGSFGGNEPLYVVDGVPVGNTNYLNPSDIETTTVLKDAPSASIYGARAAGGVIVYTTKKGSKDGKLHVSYDGVVGFTSPGKVDNILNPQEQADWTWNAVRNTAKQTNSAEDFSSVAGGQYGNNPSAPRLPDYLVVGNQYGYVGNVDLAAEKAKYNNDQTKGALYLVTPANKAGTNWWDAITNNALLNRHTIGISGGNDKSSFYVGLGMQDQQGIVLYQNFKRYSMRVNSEHKILKNLRLGENVQMTYISTTGLFGGNGGRGAAGDENDVLSAFRMPAIIPVHDAFGGYGGTAAKGFNNPNNPVAARNRQKDNKGYGFGFTGNAYLEWDVVKGLTLRSSIGGGISANNYHSYGYPSYENSENNTTFTYSEGNSAYTNWIFTNTAHYVNKFGMHGIDLLAGIEALNAGTGRNIDGSGQNPFAIDLNYINLTNTSNRVVNSSFTRSYNLYSLFGRAQYSFNDKYIVNGVIRRDGVSKLGSNNLYGVFPAASVAWRLSAEPFMSNIPFISDLKIRGGYGLMGNTNNVNPANKYNSYGAVLGQSYYDIGGANGSPAEGFFQNQIGNQNAKWETSVTSNIGVDGTLFDGKLDVVADFWRKDTRELLFQLELPGVVGPIATAPFINIAKMRNQGVDLQLINRGKITSDFGYEVNVTASWLQNSITSIAPGIPYFEAGGTRIGNVIRNQVGKPISSFFGYEVTNLFQNQAEVDAAPAQDGKGIGRFRYKDINGDGKITPDDRTYLGSPIPKFNGGINLTLTYKNFELTGFMYTALGGKIYHFAKWFTDFYPSFTGAAYGNNVKNSFTYENGGNSTPIFENVSNISTNNGSNSYYVESGSYARLTNLQLAYRLPAAFLSKYGIERARVYLQATNLLTISKYSGLDPGVGGAADTTLGIDVGNPPVTKGFNVGVSLGF